MARSFPWYLSVVFLLLTWVLLTVEIEGTSIEAHEYYGAPLLSLLAVGLALYAWGIRVSGRTGAIALSVTLVLSVVLAAFSERLELPGNQDGAITDSVSRGAVSMFISWLALAIPPTLLKLWRSSRKTIPKIIRGGITTRSLEQGCWAHISPMLVFRSCWWGMSSPPLLLIGRIHLTSSPWRETFRHSIRGWSSCLHG